MSQKAIRAVLKANPDGLTATQISKLTNDHRGNVSRKLKTMPDAYIDRWTNAARQPKKFAPVYMTVDVPENAPMPD